MTDAPMSASRPETAESLEPGPPTAASDRYSQALRRFSGDLRMARQVWESMAQRDVQRTSLHHRLWLDVLLAANEVDEAAAQLDTMQAAGIPTDATVTWRLALTRARSGQAGAIAHLEELARTTPPPPDVLPRVFRIQVRAGHLGTAKATMQRMGEAGVRAGDEDYRPLLIDIMERKAIKDAEALVQHLLDVGAPPSSATAVGLVTMMAEAGHVDRGEQLLATLVAGGVEVPNEAREALVVGWADAEDLKATRRAITALQQAGGTATSHHRNRVLSIMAGNGDLEGAWREAMEMVGEAIPSGDNLDRMLELALKRKDIVLSLSAWDWMVMLGVPPSPNRAADLVGAVLRDGQLDLAMELYREVIRLEVTPDRRRGEELAAALVKADRLDRARTFLNELRVRKVVTRGRAWGPLLAALARRKRTDELVALVTDLVANDITPTVSDASRTVGAVTRDGALDQARALLGTLAGANVTVDEPTHRELLWAYARKGRAEQAKEVLAAMVAAGITTDERHDKAIAWATGETQRRLPDATPDAEEAAGDEIVAARQRAADMPTPATPTPAKQDPAKQDPAESIPATQNPSEPTEAEPAADGHDDDGGDDVVTTPDPVVAGEGEAAEETLSDRDPIEDHDRADDEDATTPKPMTPAAHEQAPTQPDLDHGTAEPASDHTPGSAPDPAEDDAQRGEAPDSA